MRRITVQVALIRAGDKAVSLPFSPAVLHWALKGPRVAMNNNEEQPSGNPWVKSLLIWGGVFLALLVVVSMFNSKSEVPGTVVSYSDFRQKVEAGEIASVEVSEKRQGG
jgi:hypothetical protein